MNADRELVIPLTLWGVGGRRRRIEAVIDTGFDGWLSMPPSIIRELGTWTPLAQAMLADGSTSVFDIFEGTVTWDRRRRVIPIDEADTTPLVGTELLAGYELNARIEPGGDLAIRSLRRRRQVRFD